MAALRNVAGNVLWHTATNRVPYPAASAASAGTFSKWEMATSARRTAAPMSRRAANGTTRTPSNV